jgi:hypothetical protein
MWPRGSGDIPPLLREASVDTTIGILGQAILVLTAITLVVMLVFLILVMIRAIRRLIAELRQPIMPETDAYVPRPFDGRM